MTLAEGQAILHRISYKEGWKFYLREDGLMIDVRVQADSTGRLKLQAEETLTISRYCRFSLEYVENAQCLIDIIHNEIIWLEAHEADEWFKIDNKVWKDPHAIGREKAFKAGLCSKLEPVPGRI